MPAPETPRFLCPWENCGKSYKTRSNLQRHRREVHAGVIHLPPVQFAGAEGRIPLASGAITHDCPHPYCDRKGEKGFQRKDNLTQHRRNVHAEQIEKRERGKQARRPCNKKVKCDAQVE
ncbi:hypothetical protein BDZ91DRAFT_720818 [Kalaharituber pfeilii]|nr:hypothetical protein BDZ91DRAFT_720818 [Kalaharituber pfeilii]